MDSPGIIGEMNNKTTSLKWPQVVNDALATIKDALRQVHEIDVQIEATRKLIAKRTGDIIQLKLAEKFYKDQRKSLLDLEGPVSIIAGIRHALAITLEREVERLTLEGSFIAVKQLDGNNSLTIKDEIGSKFTLSAQRCQRISLTLQEIKEVLWEYSAEYSEAASPGPSQTLEPPEAA